MEDCFLGKATERIFLPLIKSQLPEIVDMNLPVEGIFHNLAFVSIRKRYPMQARKVVSALWGLGQMMFTKIIVVFDEDVDVQNTSEVIWRLGSNIDPRRDVFSPTGLSTCSTTPRRTRCSAPKWVLMLLARCARRATIAIGPRTS